MDELQIRVLALNAAVMRMAGITQSPEIDIGHTEIVIAKRFEKYLKGELCPVVDAKRGENG